MGVLVMSFVSLFRMVVMVADSSCGGREKDKEK